LADKPDIVVSTPSRCLMHLRQESFTLSQLETLVIDEADLILSYGHSADDIASILNGPWELPVVYRRFLMSATMTGEVEQLQGIVLRDPVCHFRFRWDSAHHFSTQAIILMKDEEDALANLSQYAVRCTEFDKFLLLYVLLKLKLIKGKILIFVNDIDRGYRLKLFLERFGLRSGVLNAELPFNSRFHAVQEFNRGVFDYLIATDDAKMDIAPEEETEETEGRASCCLDHGPKLISSYSHLYTNGRSFYRVSSGLNFQVSQTQAKARHGCHQHRVRRVSRH
jgi:ATP-dependent RNA helicase DDX56/DBP9